MTNTSQPKPANSLTPCPFGGNPKVAAQMGFPSCGIARPGPFFNDLNLGKSMDGGRKSRRRGRKSQRGGRKSRRGGENDNVSAESPLANLPPAQEPAQAPVKAVIQPPPKPQCPQECIDKGCGKRNILHKIFGMNGGRKSRRGGRKSRRGGRKSRRGGRKSRRGGRKSRRGGRKSRRGGLA
jgi:hypothetical protein